MRCPHCNKDTVPFWRTWIRGGFGRHRCPDCGGLSRVHPSLKLGLVSGCIALAAFLPLFLYASWLGFFVVVALAIVVDAALGFCYGSLEPTVGEAVSASHRISIGLWIVAALLWVGIGGFYVGWHMALRSIPVTDVFTAAQHEVYLAAVRANGDDAAYENALRSDLSFLDTLNARSSHDSRDQWSYAFGRALTLARLSRLAQKRGAVDEAAQFAQAAEALCPTARVPGCSVSKLLEVADKMDNGTLFDSPETRK